MANAIGKNPIVADVSGTSIAPGETRIQAIAYLVGTSDGAACRIHDGNGGDLLFEAKGAANTTITFNLQKPLRVSGLYLTTLEALGKVLVYTCPSDRPYYP